MTDPGLPKIIGCLSWYDESPAWLAGTIASCAGVIDHLIAVDGGYAAFPGALERPMSRIEEAEVIVNACHGAGIGLTLHRQRDAWMGNEVEKRSLALDLCYNTAREQDWICIFDGDEMIRYAAPDLKHKLAETEYYVAAYALHNPTNSQDLHDRFNNRGGPPTYYENENVDAIRDIHRAVPGLHYEDAHYVLTTTWPDGQKKYFRGMNGTHEPMVPCFDATQLLVFEHRNKQRHPERQERQREFYRRRDAYGLEAFHQYAMPGPDGEPVLYDPAKASLKAEMDRTSDEALRDKLQAQLDEIEELRRTHPPAEEE